MEKTVSVSRSFEESDRADKEFYRRLTPEQRLEILQELIQRRQTAGDHEASARLDRVYRIIKF